MSGLLPDSTPGILPAQWLEILQKQQASPDFAIQLQLLTDEQLLSSSKGKVTRGLNQQKRGGGGGARADAKQQQKKGGQPRAGGGWASSASSDGGSAGAGSEGTSLDAIDEDEAASTNVESRVSKASALSNRDPNDSDFTDATRSVGRSEINSVIGLPAPSESADESTVGLAVPVAEPVVTVKDVRSCDGAETSR
ncbi:hypothetical protein DIPPA_12431 [Diplonema papillatum]|nr:hypothetical protein DIPPA_12431 [Diplonema papillatum]